MCDVCILTVVPPNAAAAAATAQNIALQQQQQQQQQAASSASLALSQQITNAHGQIVAIGAAQVTNVNCFC